ncbi:MAG TPA: hypothetical protein VFS16_10440 [Acidimicrobiia bacterium]|nr:hypothetical protein [Acidimicrobiia bacterium]
MSMAVALQLSVALVVVAARAGRDISPSATEVSAGAAPDGSILSGARIPKRRGTARPATPPPAPPASTTTTSAPAPTTTAPPATVAPPTTKAPPTTAKATQTTAARPAAGERPERTPRPTAAATKAPPAPPTSPAAAGDKGQPGTLADQPGDTVADGSGAALRDSRADIVRVGAVYGPEGVSLAMQVDRPTDPRKDERWAADSTYAQWELDTNGDSVADFEVQYYMIDEENLGGSVSKPGDTGEPVCDISRATYSADGYRVTFDAACLGDPASFSYRGTLYYDTNPADENAEVATDAAPNGGWSFPIPRSS